MKRMRIAWLCSAVLILAGCGTDAQGLWGDLLVTPAVREACADVMTESEMITAVTMAQLDQINGYTKEEELASAAEGCTTDAATGAVTHEQCMACKTAILDQAYGQ
jgi:hypothetical protein